MEIWAFFRAAPKGLSESWKNGQNFADAIFQIQEVSMELVPTGPVGYKSSVVQVMAWVQTWNKPLPEMMLTQITIYASPGLIE